MQPEFGELMQIVRELGLLEDLEALAVRGEHPVLDPVVDHLREMAGPARPDVRVPVRRRQGQEDRLRAFDRIRIPADHQTVPVGQAPNPARRPGIDERDALGFREFVAGLRIAEVRVAAVDDRVAGSSRPTNSVKRYRRSASRTAP